MSSWHSSGSELDCNSTRMRKIGAKMILLLQTHMHKAGLTGHWWWHKRRYTRIVCLVCSTILLSVSVLCALAPKGQEESRAGEGLGRGCMFPCFGLVRIPVYGNVTTQPQPGLWSINYIPLGLCMWPRPVGINTRLLPTGTAYIHNDMCKSMKRLTEIKFATKYTHGLVRRLNLA